MKNRLEDSLMNGAVLSDRSVRSYIENGYLVVQGLVANSDIEAVCAETLLFARGDCPAINPLPVPVPG